jgi:hypothetical protein
LLLIDALTALSNPKSNEPDRAYDPLHIYLQGHVCEEKHEGIYPTIEDEE